MGTGQEHKSMPLFGFYVGCLWKTVPPITVLKSAPTFDSRNQEKSKLELISYELAFFSKGSVDFPGQTASNSSPQLSRSFSAVLTF